MKEIISFAVLVVIAFIIQTTIYYTFDMAVNGYLCFVGVSAVYCIRAEHKRVELIKLKENAGNNKQQS